MQLSKSDIDTYETDGVVCLRKALPQAVVDELRVGIEATMASLEASESSFDLTDVAEAFRDDGKVVPSDERYENDKPRGRFRFDVGAWMRIDEVKNVAVNSALPEICATLMGSKKLNFYDDQIFCKDPNSMEITAYHQDHAFIHIEGNDFCAAWVPVDVVTESSGGLKYVKGSHKWNREFVANIFVSQMGRPGGTGEVIEDVNAFLENHEIICYEMEPGDVLVHDSRVVHGAGGNCLSDLPRRAASFWYCGDDISYKHRTSAPPKRHHVHDLEDGDKLDCAQFPVVWPKELRRYL